MPTDGEDPTNRKITGGGTGRDAQSGILQELQQLIHGDAGCHASCQLLLELSASVDAKVTVTAATQTGAIQLLLPVRS